MKALEYMAHKFPHLNDVQLCLDISALNNKVVQMQRSKQRDKLPELQRTLHLMRMEHKRRESAAKRAKYNG